MRRAPRSRRVDGARSVVALLPSGDLVWLQVRDATVSLREMDRMVDLLARAERRKARAIKRNAEALRSASRQVKRSVKALTRASARRATATGRRAARADSAIEKRISTSLGKTGRETRDVIARDSEQLRRLSRTTLWRSVLTASALPLVAAYGRRGNQLAESNLVIAVGLAVWLCGDAVADFLAGKRPDPDNVVRDQGVWLYTAPLANLLTGYLLLGGRQHDRFATGVAGFSQDSVVTEYVGVPGRLASDTLGAAAIAPTRAIVQRDTYWHTVDLRRTLPPGAGPGTPVLASPHTVRFREGSWLEEPRLEVVSAEVRNGKVYIVLRAAAAVAFTEERLGDPPPLVEHLEVAWAVDTEGAAA